VRGQYRQRLANTVAQQISSALHDLTIQETLREQASRDALTGLFNRRYMEETLHRELYRATRKKSQIGFLLLDIDHFKRLNDRFGHRRATPPCGRSAPSCTVGPVSRTSSAAMAARNSCWSSPTARRRTP